jgi:hypothetical protein
MITIERSVLEQALDALWHGITVMNHQGCAIECMPLHLAARAISEALAQPAAQPTIDLSRLDPFVGGLGKAILQELKEDLAAQPAPQPAAQPTEPAGEPVAWAVYWGIGDMRRHSVHFEIETAKQATSEIKSNPSEIRPLYTRPAVLPIRWPRVWSALCETRARP